MDCHLKLLNDNHIQINMTKYGDPIDKAKAEHINNTMKNELVKGEHFTSIGEITATVSNAVDFYKKERHHMSIYMMMPSMAALCGGEITKRWIIHHEKAKKKCREKP